MTKTAARKLTKGQEIYNRDTGEVALFHTTIGTLGDILFVEGADLRTPGRHFVWSNEKTEQV